ncbi:hypothetical protein FKM82_027786 [Ascaphus truei]
MYFSNEQKQSNMNELKKEIEKEVSERIEKGKAAENLQKVVAELEETRNTLKNTEKSLIETNEEIERTRALESKAFQEKEECRSKLEEAFEEMDKMFMELDLLKKQVAFLAEENGKLLGHQNPNQKIQYLVKLKKDNVKLTEEAEKLRLENTILKEVKKCENC